MNKISSINITSSTSIYFGIVLPFYYDYHQSVNLYPSLPQLFIFTDMIRIKINQFFRYIT